MISSLPLKKENKVMNEALRKLMKPEIDEEELPRIRLRQLKWPLRYRDEGIL